MSILDYYVLNLNIYYGRYIARRYQEQYEQEHTRRMEGMVSRTNSELSTNETGMEDFYLAAKIQQEEENLRLAAEIDKACEQQQESMVDHDNESMGENADEGMHSITKEESMQSISEETKDDGMADNIKRYISSHDLRANVFSARTAASTIL